jgi:hypothetical protein
MVVMRSDDSLKKADTRSPSSAGSARDARLWVAEFKKLL